MQFIQRRSKRVKICFNINLKFHDYSIFVTVFDVASNSPISTHNNIDNAVKESH